jgi:hypothetical protein
VNIALGFSAFMPQCESNIVMVFGGRRRRECVELGRALDLPPIFMTRDEARRIAANIVKLLCKE